jgi:inosine-uridine nucleoside N-ribohydrolase
MERLGRSETDSNDLIPCDSYAAAIMINESLVTEREKLHITIELAGTHTKGATIIDWYNLR